jgi:hypothetical protein
MVKVVNTPTSGRDPEVAAASKERAAANAASSVSATASTAGQGSAGIADGDKAKRAIENGPPGL